MSALIFNELFDPTFLARLSGLSLRTARAEKGGRPADQRTLATGQGSDFAEFKPYSAGDDLRAMDWNIYRRLGKLFVRVFEERQDLPVYVMVDVSRSMFVETPPRIRAALRAALALSAIALKQHDAVSIIPFSEEVAVHLRGLSGRAGIARVAHSLAGLEPAGRTALASALGRIANMKLRRGLLVIVSDFFDDDGLDQVLAALGRLSHRLLLVQVVKRHDADPSLHPELGGDVLIEDGEGQAAALSMTPEIVARYRDLYASFVTRLSDFAAVRGAGLVRLDADLDVIDQLTPLLAGRSATL